MKKIPYLVIPIAFAFFMFNYAATLEKAKENSIDHILNYLKSGKVNTRKIN